MLKYKLCFYRHYQSGEGNQLVCESFVTLVEVISFHYKTDQCNFCTKKSKLIINFPTFFGFNPTQL